MKQRPITDRSTELVTFRGIRDKDAPVSEECKVTVNREPLDPRLDLVEHSPSGLSWLGGSGAAQLAVAILAEAGDVELALAKYQEFKQEIIANLPRDGWTLSSQDIETWLHGVDR